MLKSSPSDQRLVQGLVVNDVTKYLIEDSLFPESIL